MRALKVILVALGVVFAFTAGLFITAIVAAASILMLSVRRLFGSPRNASAPAAQSRPAPNQPAGEIIDVTATEIRADVPRIERAPSP